MTITEKLAYIKGLTEGLALDDSKPEVKVLRAIIDLLDDVTYDLSDMEDLYDELSGQVDEIDQDLAEVESELYDDEEVEFDDDDFGDAEDDFDDEDHPFYEVTCGKCNEKIYVSEDVLLEGEIECPNCGELLEFDFSELFNEDDVLECDADCKGCSGCDPEPEAETKSEPEAETKEE